MYLAKKPQLLYMAGLFLVIHALLYTLSPSVKYRSWDVQLQWSQWISVAIWGGAVYFLNTQINKYKPDADPFLFPIAALLTGWGILTIWHIEPEFGVRQTTWFAASMILFGIALRFEFIDILKKYKYIMLLGGAALTALTFFFGTNPSGGGPRLWLGCCTIYFQPSEPLKLLLIVYLAAYFSEKVPYQFRLIHLLYPTLLLGGFVIVMVIAQRDLGTASIFIALYTLIAYLSTNRRTILIISVLTLLVVGVTGYFLIDIIRIRIESWIYPWNDPQGGSYQIVQALIALANGGLDGRGPGLGYPGLVPVSISDFIYIAIGEETGLIGTLGIISLYCILLTRSTLIALRAPDHFRRFLASGITIHFGVQSILIIGGNLRLLPLTGVTLPFVSYGGSSLLTSYIAILILSHISNQKDDEPASLVNPNSYQTLNSLLLAGLFAAGLVNGWWSIIRAADLEYRRDNLRRIIIDKFVERGTIFDSGNIPITESMGEIGSFSRIYKYPALAPVVGYSDPIYGQVGLEDSLDGYLRGLDGSSASSIWLNHLLYGMTPPGLDVRLSIDLNLQKYTDELIFGKTGAVVMLNAETGEILVMSSSPTFDQNKLHENATDLLNDPKSPLVNRAALGYYPLGSIIDPFSKIYYGVNNPSAEQIETIYETLGFFQVPSLRLDVYDPNTPSSNSENFHTSPLHLAIAGSALSNDGIIPAPRLAMAVNSPNNGWVVLPAEGMPKDAIPSTMVNDAINQYIKGGQEFWSFTGLGKDQETSVTWFLGGTPPDWPGSRVTIVILLEEFSPTKARMIGESILSSIIKNK